MSCGVEGTQGVYNAVHHDVTSSQMFPSYHGWICAQVPCEYHQLSNFCNNPCIALREAISRNGRLGKRGSNAVEEGAPHVLSDIIFETIFSIYELPAICF